MDANPDAVNVYSSLLGLIVPAIVDVIKRRFGLGDKEVVLTALGITAVLYVILQLLSGTLMFPVPLSFWQGLLAIFGGQQLIYLLVFKERNPAPTQTTQTTIAPAAMVMTETTTTEHSS